MALIELFYAIQNPSEKNIILLLEQYLSEPGHSIEDRNSEGDTLLHTLVTHNLKQEVEYLIQKGAQVDSTNNANETPLMKAAAFHNSILTEILLKAGANVHAKTVINRTPLMEVFISNNSFTDSTQTTIDLLVEHGANVDAKDAWGDGLIRYALFHNKHTCPNEKEKFFRSLLLKGAPIYLSDLYSVVKGITSKTFDPTKWNTHNILSLLSELDYPIFLPWGCAQLFSTVQAALDSGSRMNIVELRANKESIPFDFFTRSGLNQYVTYRAHNLKIMEMPFQLGQQTPLLDKLSRLVGEYITNNVHFHQNFEACFKKGRTLQISKVPTVASLEEAFSKTNELPRLKSLG